MATAVNTSSQQYFGFDPRTIPGCVLWMDAADRNVTFSDTGRTTLATLGGTVVRWNDKSGFSNHVTASSGTTTLTASAINGVPALSFANSWFTGGFSSTYTGNQLRGFGVATLASASGLYPRIFTVGRPGVDDYNSTTTTFLFIRNNGGQNLMVGRSTGANYLTVSIPAYSTPFLVQAGHDSNIESIAVNGALTPSSLNTGITTNFNITSYGIGINTNTADAHNFTGLVGEIIYYTENLTTAQIQQVEGYLAWKWGLQANLPVGHAFKYNPTTMRVFRPVDIEACAMWLDAADLSTILPANITSGTAITEWRDKSVSATFAVPQRGASGTAPVFSNVGGVPSIFINNGGVNANYNASTYAQLQVQSNIQTTQDYSVFAVVNLCNVSSAVNQTIYSNRRGGVERAPQLGPGSTFESISTGPFRLIEVGFLGTGIRQTSLVSTLASFVQLNNGAAYGSVVSNLANRFTADADPPPTIGGTFSSVGQDNRFTTGHFHELIVYNKALTTSERQQVEGYLAEKWRTPALPTTQPYFDQRALPSTPLFVPTSITPTSNPIPNLFCRFFNLTSTPPSTTLGGTGWGSEIGTRGYYSPINFQDGDSRIGQSDNVGIACTGFVFSASGGTIRFRVVTDDGSIVRFNGVDVISSWTFQGDTTYTSALLTLNAGYTSIEYLFFEGGGGMTCELYYELNNSGTFLSDGTGVFVGSINNPIALWLDAADSSTLTTSGTTVTQWRDKSGNSRHMNVGSGTTSYISNSVRLNNSYMFVTTPVNLQNFVFFIVCEAPIPIGGNQPVFTGRPNTANSYGSTDGFSFYIDSAQVRMYGTLTAATSITNTLTPSTRFLTSFVGVSAGGLSSFQDGKWGGSAATSARGTTAQGFAIGAEWENGAYVKAQSTAYIYEIVVYNTVLTAFQRQQVEGYLAWKWGLQTLLPTAPTFTPASVSPAIWLDAEDASTFTLSGSNVAEWRDKSGNSRHYSQATDANRPTRANNTVSTTGNQFLINASPLAIGGYDVFVVGKPLSSTATGTWRTLLRGSASEHPIIVEAGSTRLGTYLNTDAFQQFGQAGQNLLTLDGTQRTLIYLNIPTSRVLNASLNGVTGTSTTASGSAALVGTNFYALGNIQGGGQPWGDMNEVIIIPNTTLAVRRQIEEYLALKWGVPLPSPVIHPFSKFRP